MPRLSCATLQPRYLASDLDGYRSLVETETGEIIEAAPGEQRQFLTRLLDETDPGPVLRALYRETVKVVLLVRERLEREKPYEALIERPEIEEAVAWAETAMEVVE